MKNYVVITGASSGIGKEFSKYYAKQGKNLLLIARSKEKLSELKEELVRTYEVEVEFLILDLSKEYSAKKVQTLVDKLNINVEIVVNCAGVATSGTVDSVSLERQHDEIMLNVVSLFDLTKLFLKEMLKNDKGLIINVASSSAYHPIPTMSVYAATKAFVLSFSEALSMECKDTNVRVFAISPGATDTNFFSNGGGVAYGRLRTPEDVVKTTIKAIDSKKISKIDGFNNYFTSTILPRVLPRASMAKFVYNIMKKQIKD